MSLITKIFGDRSASRVKQYEPIVAKISAHEVAFQALSMESLKAKTLEFRARLEGGETLDDLLPEAFALVREAGRRTRGERHFDVQLVGGVVLHDHAIAEMRTGEGKTLVATLAAYLNALTSAGVHVVTVNDYLSRRDTAWMGEIYHTLGLSVAVINHETSFIYDPSHTTKEEDKDRDEKGFYKVEYDFLRPCSRREAYLADITYGTNSEFGFDYLRDNLAYNSGQLVQRGHNYAIVDEVDSILIDEARTPLIISGPAAESESLYSQFAKIAKSLVDGEDYIKDEKLKAITLTDKGIEKTEKILGVENIYTEKGIKYVHHLETAVRAQALFLPERDYVVKDDKVVIVDAFTGRLQPGRRWSEGLHQAIEAKEGVKVEAESRTYASITYQNYFRMYNKLSGMTGTALTSAEEFAKVYGLEVVPIPTNKPSRRVDSNDLIFQTEKGKFTAVARRVKELQEKGQPVLIGTVSIDKNEMLSAYLQKEGIKHNLLNAKNNEREGEIIAEAGRRGSVTVATNMAGRGVDIKLGGPMATSEEANEVKSLGGLFVLGTERHEARRIDNQLRGRAGRQGDLGETQFFVSLEDDLMRIFGSEKIKSMMGRFGIDEDEPIDSRLVSRSIEGAQEKIEGFHFDSRKHVLEYDDVLGFQRNIIYGRRRKLLVGTDEEVELYLAELIAGAPELEDIIKKKREELDASFINATRQLILQIMDMLWLEHLEAMDYLRSSVRLRAYGQRDPLIEYKREGLSMFKELEATLVGNVIHLLPQLGAVKTDREERNLREIKEGADNLTSRSQSNSLGGLTPKSREVGRNDPCPCGSGLKYKKCGMIGAKEHKS
ncbi:MAG TPA: preprotein translocase subunit SecA [Candidatus Paceibacterota bacterium]